MQVNGSIITLCNKDSQLSLDLCGGAILQFCLKKGGDEHQNYSDARQKISDVNPLDFRFEQQTGTSGRSFYQGHFLCLGRWGDSSEGEKKAGIPKHGDFTGLRWECNHEECNHDDGNHEDGIAIRMQALSVKEGLSIDRRVIMAREQSCFKVEETVRNIQPLGRIYNMVQHPTIGGPFLGPDTRIDCNASEGFDYAQERYEGKIFSHWPHVKNSHGEIIDLVCPEKPYDSVFPFIVDPDQQWGWLTAFSPDQGLLLGYVWQRRDYPWINLWNHWSDGRLIYRGLEFGTTGIHKPFEEILDKQLTHLLGERTYRWLDAGGQVTKEYWCFLQSVGSGFKGVDQVLCGKEKLTICEKETGSQLIIKKGG